MRLTLCICAVAALAGPAAAAAPTIAKPTPAATLHAEITAFNAKNFRAAYSAYTAAYRAKCPYATFAKKMAAQRAQVPAPLKLGVRVTSSRIVGTKATLGYSVLLGGSAVHQVKGDVFQRAGGLWYDQLDAQTTCGD